MPTLEENKAVVHRFIEELQNRHDPGVIDELFSRDFVNHSGGVTTIPGLAKTTDFEGIKEADRFYWAAFPEQHTTVEHMIAEGDKVATMKTFEAVHKGEFMGIPPTGKKVTISAVDILRIRDGKIAEHWAVFDMWGLMRQLGAVE